MGLNRNIPHFRRAREYHLFDDKGQRFLDLYQNDGRAIMGHRPGKFSHYLKNSLSRGMWADYPTPLNNRVGLLLQKIHPSYGYISLFRNYERALQALDLKEVGDPLYEDKENLRWRPFLPDHPQRETLFIRLPLAGMMETQIVLSRKELPEGDEISPIWIEGIIRLLHDFINWSEKNPKVPFSYDSKKLIQRGPYLLWKEIPENYDEIFNKALEKGLLFPPEAHYPLMIPYEMSDYERKILFGFLEEIL